MTDNDDNDLTTYLRAHCVTLEAALHRERAKTAELLGLIGLLREGLGTGWMVVYAAYEEAKRENWVPLSSLLAAVDDLDRRMAEADAYFGHDRVSRKAKP